MTTAETNGRPFWAEAKPWQEAKLPKIEGATKVEEVASAVPSFTTVETPLLFCSYTLKDGLLLYQIFHRQRKEIFDAAEAEMNRIRDTVRNPAQVQAEQQEVATKANVELAKHPWWPMFEQVLKTIFERHFRYHPFKVNFYPETDSWSVAMPKPTAPGGFSSERLAAPVHELSELHQVPSSGG